MRSLSEVLASIGLKIPGQGPIKPELFNRIDHVIPFRRLAEADVLRIVDLELEKAASRAGLLRRRLRLVVEPDARAWLARHGYDPKLGARPLKRAIQKDVENPVAKLILEGRFGPKDVIPVDYEDGRFIFERVVH